MSKAQRIDEPTRPGLPFVAIIVDPESRIVASHGCPTRAGADTFSQAFMQEEYGLRGDPQESPGR